jgi:hypothetical protein
MIVVILFVAKSVKMNQEKTVRRTLLAFSIITVMLELVKQGLFTHVASTYQWYAFPFQFCSSPMYISILALTVKNPKIKEALYSFLAFYGLFGGLIVMIYPGDVFTDLVMINIQTMIHHGGMVVVGTTLILAQKVKFDFKSLVKASYVFLGLILIAQGMNFIAYYANVGTFNMFFISPFGTNHLPVLSTIQSTQPYLVFLIIYILGFTFAAFVIQKSCVLIQYIYRSICKANPESENNTLCRES